MKLKYLEEGLGFFVKVVRVENRKSIKCGLLKIFNNKIIGKYSCVLNSLE